MNLDWNQPQLNSLTYLDNHKLHFVYHPISIIDQGSKISSQTRVSKYRNGTFSLSCWCFDIQCQWQNGGGKRKEMKKWKSYIRKFKLCVPSGIVQYWHWVVQTQTILIHVDACYIMPSGVECQHDTIFIDIIDTTTQERFEPSCIEFW